VSRPRPASAKEHDDQWSGDLHGRQQHLLSADSDRNGMDGGGEIEPAGHGRASKLRASPPMMSW
jgi:hypothetical protein